MPAEPPTPTAAALPADPLLERERELALLRTLLAEAAGGRAQLALIEGHAGIGKSRLLAELREMAAGAAGAGAADAGAAGAGDRGQPPAPRVLSARASEFERALPFGVVRQLFEPLVRGGDDLLAGAAASARPALTATTADPATAPDAPQDSSFAVLHGLYWLVVDLAAERPLLLSIDDLHWCDRSSLRFLAYLLRRVEGLPVLVATTLRSTEPGTDAALLAEIAHDPATVSVRPGPLSRAGVAALVTARLGAGAAPAFVDACASGTGGNPLLLRQLVTALAADGVRPTAANAAIVEEVGPRAIGRTVLLRLGRLSPAAVAVARAVAILGETAGRPAVCALAGLDDAAVAEATDALVRAEILAPGTPPAFVHPLVRDAVYHELPAAERERQHVRAAEGLRAAGAPADEVAQHLLATPGAGDGATVEALRAASRSALRKGAADGAVAYLRRALDEPPAPPIRPQVLLELGQAEAMTNGAAAVAHLREAYELAGDPQARAQAAVVYGRALVFSGEVEEATRVARAAADELGPELADARQALDAIAAIAYSSGLGDYRSTLDVVAPWRARREGTGPGAKMVAAMTAFALAAAGGASAAECVPMAREALAGDVLLPFDGGHVSVATTVVLALADDDGALATVAALQDHAHRRGSMFAAMAAGLWGGWTHHVRGDLTSAEAAMAGGHEAHVEGEFSFGVLFAAAFLAETLVERGDLAGARQALTREAIGPDGTEGFQLVRRARILIALAEGDAQAALALLDGYERRLGLPMHPTWDPWRSLTARALQGLGRRDEAAEVLEEELTIARGWGAPGTVGATLWRLGDVVGGAAGEAHLREAIDLLAGSTRRLEHAKALAALGAALRRDRRPADAREPLREALALADACGAGGLAEQVRTELYAAGARPRREALSGVAALTASERRVAGLAAEGRSNREIAQALYVTPKTVEVHLTNAYRKLGIRSRRGLAEALDRPGSAATAGPGGPLRADP